MPKVDSEEAPAGAGAIPIVDEADPGLGRRSGYLRSAREQSGGLEDSPGDLVEVHPFRQTQGRR